MTTKIMDDVYTTVHTIIITVKEDAVRNAEEIGVVAKAVGTKVI